MLFSSGPVSLTRVVSSGVCLLPRVCPHVQWDYWPTGRWKVYVLACVTTFGVCRLHSLRVPVAAVLLITRCWCLGVVPDYIFLAVLLGQGLFRRRRASTTISRTSYAFYVDPWLRLRHLRLHGLGATLDFPTPACVDGVFSVDGVVIAIFLIVAFLMC